MLSVRDLDDPEVLPEGITVLRKHSAGFLDSEPLLLVFEAQGSAYLLRIEILIVPSGDIRNLRPFPLQVNFILSPDRRHPEAVSGTGHEVGDDALVGLARVDLPELLHGVDLDADSVLQDVLELRLLLAEVLGVGPGDLNGGRGLGDVREEAPALGVGVELELVLLGGEVEGGEVDALALHLEGALHLLGAVGGGLLAHVGVAVAEHGGGASALLLRGTLLGALGGVEGLRLLLLQAPVEGALPGLGTEHVLDRFGLAN